MNAINFLKKHKLNKLLFCSLLVVCCYSCSGNITYGGDYPDLFSIAINSLLGTNGYISSETLFPPVVELLESDQYGRKLFCYSEGDSVSLLISQSKDDTYAYYYSDYNFISSPIAEGNEIYLVNSKTKSEIANPYNDYTNEEINVLKSLNDWDLSINPEKFAKVKIRDAKENKSEFENTIESIFDAEFGNTIVSKPYRFSSFLTSDGFGKNIFYAYGVTDYDATTDKRIALIINDDKTVNNTFFIEIVDIYNYQSSLKTLKEINDWGK